jgi:hypothetical protein
LWAFADPHKRFFEAIKEDFKKTHPVYFAVLESTDGSPCKTDDTNVVTKNPLDYFDTISDGSVNYLSNPFAIGRTPMDTFTFNTVVGSSVSTTGLFDPPTNPEDRYKGNYDLQNTETYLVKIARDYARRAGIKDDTTFFRDILIWDENNRTITVNLHYKTRVYSIDPKDDSSIVVLPVSNGHSKVNTREFIEYFYLTDITDYFYGRATYKEYTEQDVGNFVSMLKVGIGNLLTGEKNPWDTPGLRAYYFIKVWPDRFAQMVQDHAPVPEDIGAYATWIANNYYNWMDSIGLASPNSAQMNANWNDGTYVVQAAAAYAGIWYGVAVAGDLATLATAEVTTFQGLAATFGYRTVILAYLNGNVSFLQYLKTISDEEAILGTQLENALVSELAKQGMTEAEIAVISEEVPLVLQGAEENAIIEAAAAAEEAATTFVSELLETEAASEWGIIEGGANQGVKHFAGYWDKYPDRIPSIASRLGVPETDFAKTSQGFINFTNQALRVVAEGTAKDVGGGKVYYYLASNAKDGVLIVMKDGKLQSMMASNIKYFTKLLE